jgi:hypothetical protein
VGDPSATRTGEGLLEDTTHPRSSRQRQKQRRSPDHVGEITDDPPAIRTSGCLEGGGPVRKCGRGRVLRWSPPSEVHADSDGVQAVHCSRECWGEGLLEDTTHPRSSRQRKKQRRSHHHRRPDHRRPSRDPDLWVSRGSATCPQRGRGRVCWRTPPTRAAADSGRSNGGRPTTAGEITDDPPAIRTLWEGGPSECWGEGFYEKPSGIKTASRSTPPRPTSRSRCQGPRPGRRSGSATPGCASSRATS